MQSWITLIPPLLTLGVAYYTRKITYSLLLGIISACFIITGYALIPTAFLSVKSIWQTTQIGNLLTLTGPLNRLYMFIFLVVLGTIISLISHTGGINAYGRFVRPRVRNAREAESASIILSLLLFIDDYLSNLTTGSVMRPITDSFNIPRAKLAFLVNSMAAPITILSPVSSWVAEIVTQLSNSGINTSASALINANPFTVYLNLIPFIFYSFILCASVLFIVKRDISFGVMAQQEHVAQKTGNLFGGKKSLGSNRVSSSKSDSLIDFLLPVVLLISFVILGLLYTGYQTGSHTLIEAFQHGDIFTALLSGGCISLLSSLLFALARKKITLPEIPFLFMHGWGLMYSSIIMLCLAWTFSSLITNELGTGQYLAHLVVGTLPLFLLPIIFFILSIITTIAIGSSWGAIAIMIAIAVPMIISLSHVITPALLTDIPLLLPTLGAILSGAIAGNTISPIGDATIMASTSTQSYHQDHVQTQTAYSFYPIVATGCTYIVYNFLASFISLFISAFIAVIVGIV